MTFVSNVLAYTNFLFELVYAVLRPKSQSIGIPQINQASCRFFIVMDWILVTAVIETYESSQPYVSIRPEEGWSWRAGPTR
jgi:hypothetical protein